jgi:uncharacterized protein (DUF488 family)
VSGRIYSIGYEGLTVGEFIERLVDAGVNAVVDVRLNPVSRKPGFSYRQLRDSLHAAGLDYIHERDLGNPPRNRAAFHDADHDAGRARMRSILTDVGGEALARLVDLASERRVAVLCLERDVARCHRSVVLQMVVERDPGIEVVEIS